MTNRRTSGSGRRSSSSVGRSSTAPRSSSRSNLPYVPPKKPAEPATSKAEKPAPGRSTGEIFKDMAATATGVAVGSAVGHAVGAGITGAFSGRRSSEAQPAEQQEASSSRRAAEGDVEGPCSYELKQFLKCSEESGDLSACQGFNEALRQCRQRYNL